MVLKRIREGSSDEDEREEDETEGESRYRSIGNGRPRQKVAVGTAPRVGNELPEDQVQNEQEGDEEETWDYLTSRSTSYTQSQNEEVIRVVSCFYSSKYAISLL